MPECLNNLSADCQNPNQWGYLRESQAIAQKAGVDRQTKICRTGLDTYLKVIFPNINDWVHDQQVPGMKHPNGKVFKGRPDYRSESLKMIVEFDGLNHYTSPVQIDRDEYQTKIYKEAGYTVVRIPYFIQLTRQAVEILFGVKLNQELFNPQYASLGVASKNTPAFLCIEGIMRMRTEFSKFPCQRSVNIESLKKEPQQKYALWQLI
ncbi:MAG: endonuclease domain-containing protein [Muribaculaceae bacterium]|nr:endonuclease domain-containing protein [Muribaculaceae bacterium]